MAYPFPIELLPSPDWLKLNVPVTDVKVSEIHPTQYYLVIDRLLWIYDGHDPEGNDYPHIVEWEGKLWLHDGHHRWAAARMRGDATLACRVFKIAG